MQHTDFRPMPSALSSLRGRCSDRYMRNGSKSVDNRNGRGVVITKSKRMRRSHMALLACILLGSCLIQITSFSIRQRPIASTPISSEYVVRWQPQSQSSQIVMYSTSTSSTSAEPQPQQSVRIDKATTATASSTDEKISQLKEQHQKKKHNTSSSSRPPNNKRYSNNNRRPGPGNRPNGTPSQRTSQRQNKKRHIRNLYSQARGLEKRGQWREASEILEHIISDLEPEDAHSYLALAKLESRRERGGRVRVGVGRKKDSETNNDKDSSNVGVGNDEGSITKKFKNARHIFETAIHHCPTNVHLYHAWAMHEQSLGNIPKARELFDKALEFDPWNGYVCHAYGLLEMNQPHDDTANEGGGGVDKDGNSKKARQLWQRGLTYQPSAALVCSLGHLYTTSGHALSARELYSTYVPKMTNPRERIEVYLAASSLEETVFRDVERASALLKEALARSDGEDGEVGVHDSRAYVALARLGTSGGLVDDLVVKKRLKEICVKQWKRMGGGKNKNANANNRGRSAFPVNDGRLFNAWAKLESKTNLREARKILKRGMMMYPKDQYLLQAAGNIEERLGNVTSARDLYGASLHLEPSAPALIAYAMLELRSPEDGGDGPNVTMMRKLFDEALLIDPKHGPVYNAYGNLERREGNADRARQLYEDGINANCTDAPSVYHGLAKLHLSLGEVEEARSVLRRGLALFGKNENESTNTTYSAAQRPNENVAFLAHTLALIELNVNNNAKLAKEVLKQGLWHCRNSPQLLLAMALCESRMGNENGARDMFERSLTADQRHAQAWQAFGVMEMQAGNFRTAKTLFECGLKNTPTHGALWQAYGTLESWKGNISTARLLYAAGIQKCPQHVPLYQAWACLELRSGDVITAKRLIGEALTKDKRNGSGWLVLAQIEEKMDNHGLVGLILRRGIECAPGNTELYRVLAEHEISLFKFNSARELLEKGIEINPLYAPLYHSLAELEARIFNIEGLSKLNKRIAEMFPFDAMAEPPKERMEAWGTKIKQERSAMIPKGIAALAEKIGVDSYSTADNSMNDIAGVGSLEDVDPEELLNFICGVGDEVDSGGLMIFQDMLDDVGR